MKSEQTGNGSVLCLRQVQLIEYVMPLPRGFATSRGQITRSRNFFLRLVATEGERSWVGFGEGAPRKISGDDPKLYWTFLKEAKALLEGKQIDLTTPAAALRDLEKIMAALFQRAAAGGRSKAFRGTLTGIDMALLDLTARALGLRVSEFLGELRSKIEICASTMTSDIADDELLRRVRAQIARYPMCRVKACGNVSADVARLERVSEVNWSLGVQRPLWIDINCAYSPDEASGFLSAVAVSESIRAGASEVIIEQPVRRKERSALAELQRQADGLKVQGSPLIHLMADESLWDVVDFRRLVKAGRCGAINIKIHKAGGLLAGLRLAHAAFAHDPELRVYVGAMVGTSDLTTWALINFAKAVPRLDYITAGPKSNLEAQLCVPAITYATLESALEEEADETRGSVPGTSGPGAGEAERRASNIVVRQNGYGLGAIIDEERLAMYSERSEPCWPVSAGAATTEQVVAQEVLAPLGRELALGSHLLEREALIAGFNICRLNKGMFFAYRGSVSLPFYASAAAETSRFGLKVCGDKGLTRTLLERAQVPVSAGRVFQADEMPAALAYARTLSWPLVAKPVLGMRGQGVVTGIASETELSTVLQRFAQAGVSFLVEEHLPGRDYRFVVVGDEVVSVIYRKPAKVVGDGHATIAALIRRKNAARTVATSPIKTGSDVRRELQLQGLSLESVPGLGQEVWICRLGSLSQGGEAHQVLADTHPELKTLALEARKAIPGIAHCGIDVLLEDHTKPLSSQRVGICEVNSYPALLGSHFPSAGAPVNMARALIAFYARRAGVPVIDFLEKTVVQLEVHGCVVPDAVEQWLYRAAESVGLDAVQGGRRDPHLVAVGLTGSPAAVAELSSRAISQRSWGDVSRVEVRHVAI